LESIHCGSWYRASDHSLHPYWNPYIVGVGIGLLIILSVLVTGRGLGAVGAFNGILASLAHAIAPDYALSKGAYSAYIS